MMFAGVSEMVDFALLPEFDRIGKYFGLSASYAISTGEGFFFECAQLKPPTAQRK